MTEKPLILICDDQEAVGRAWKRRLERLDAVSARFRVTTAPDDLGQEIQKLEERRQKARQDGADFGDSIFDDVAILFVDYDLLDLDETVFHTGEAVAYLVRCYSGCDLIVSVNQFGSDNFDLTLRDHPQSYADLNIGDKFLDNPGLWQERPEGWNNFRPWAWPILPDVLDKYRKRVAGLQEHIEESILEYLDFPSEMLTVLPRAAVEFVEKRQSIADTTFKRFVQESEEGLRIKDKPLNKASIPRIAAARLSKWLECMLLPSQDILIDAPHLVSRHPALLTADDLSDRPAWNKTVDHSFGTLHKIGIKYPTIGNHYFGQRQWLSRHAWFGRSLRSDEEVIELLETFPEIALDLVFAEDRSEFVDRDDTRGFVADVPGPYARRFASNVPDIRYTPQVRFTL